MEKKLAVNTGLPVEARGIDFKPEISVSLFLSKDSLELAKASSETLLEILGEFVLISQNGTRELVFTPPLNRDILGEIGKRLGLLQERVPGIEFEEFSPGRLYSISFYFKLESSPGDSRTVSKTRELGDQVLIDLDENGKALGVEALF